LILMVSPVALAVDPAPVAPLAPEPVAALLAQPARARAATQAREPAARERDFMRLLLSEGMTDEQGSSGDGAGAVPGWGTPQRTARQTSPCCGGRHRKRRRSSRVMRNSARSGITAVRTMQASTPLWLKLPWADLIRLPSPRSAPRNSPTMAPMIANPKLTCRLARIQVNADGMTTSVVIFQREAPSSLALAIRLRSTSRVPWKALKKTPKKTRTMTSSTLEVRPRPKATTNSDPSTMRGMELATLM